MTDPEQDELQSLRARAYGPDADIHLDSGALQRLHELESRGRESEPAAPVETTEKQFDSSPPPAPNLAAPTGGDVVSAAEPHRAAPRIGRTTLLIALGLVALIVGSYAALVIVQRVQTDPLQVGASQVTRLSEDAAYEPPVLFAGQPNGSQGYQEFYGLRAIVNQYDTTTGALCIIVFPADTATDADGNFTGPAYSGCSAGAFPAAVAFTVTNELPEELRSEFPEGTALQYVLDESANEIVVFTDR